LPQEELLRRAEAAAGALSRERRRNAELVHRLQQLHGEQVRAARAGPRLRVARGAQLHVAAAADSILLYEALSPVIRPLHCQLHSQQLVVHLGWPAHHQPQLLFSPLCMPQTCAPS
jgi:hypothetical protein